MLPASVVGALGLWHPAGAPSRRLVPDRTTGAAGPPSDDGGAELVVLDGRPAGHDGWSSVARSLDRGGVAWVLLSRGRRIRPLAPARSTGLVERARVIVVGPWSAPVHLVPLEATSLAHAARGAFGLSPTVGRVVARAAGNRLGRWLLWCTAPRAAVMAQAPGGSDPLHWLAPLRDAGTSIVVGLGGRDDAPVATVTVLGPEGQVQAVVKVPLGGSAAQRLEVEQQALTQIAPPAAAAGAAVPPVLAAPPPAALAVGGVAGEPVDRLLRRRPAQADAVLELVATWLTAWHSSTASAVTLTADAVDARFLGPARAALGDDPRGLGYRQHLEELCRQATGATVRLVAAHNDLTMANVLVDGDRLAVVDWESATGDGLPTADLWYAMVDAWSRARGTSHASALAQLLAASAELAVERVATALRLTRIEAALGFHGCWLHHAANEIDRGARSGPFTDVVRTIARQPELVAGIEQRWAAACAS